MLKELFDADNMQAIKLIYKANKFYRETTQQATYRQYRFNIFLSHYVLNIAQDIEEYLQSIKKTKFTKDEAKKYKKYSALVAELRTYR